MINSSVKNTFSQRLLRFEQQNQDQIAKFYLVLGTFISTTTQVMVKSSTLSLSQYFVFRGFLIIMMNFASSSEPTYFKRTRIRKILLLQSFLAAIQSLVFVLALKILTLSQTFILYLTNTIWAQYFAYLLLNEPIKTSAIRNSIISIIGVVLITQPTSLLTKQESQSSIIYWGQLFALGSGILYALAQTLNKLIGSSISQFTKLSYYHFNCIIIGGIWMIIDQNNLDEIYSIQNIQSVILISCFSFVYHNLEYRAFSMVSLAKLAPYIFTQVIFTLGYDILLYSVIPDIYQSIGIILISLPLVIL